jgi:hypothetical protein
VRDALVKDPHEAGELSDAVYEAYREYEKENMQEGPGGVADMWPHECADHTFFMPCRPANGRSKAVHTPDHIMISERGTLKHNLTMLALTNRMVFGDLWSLYLAKYPHYSPLVANFNFRPLFRFARFLQAHTGHELKGGPQSFSIFEKDSEHTAYDFVNLRDAFQKHWIYGFPLWPIEEKYDTASGKSALLPYWLGMVRQTAALYRIDTEYWAAITNTFAKRFARAQDPAHPH